MKVHRTKAATALLLTLAAGCVDVTGFLLLYHIFTAHMTGATVHMAESAMQARWRDAWHAAAIVAAFLSGSVGGRALIEYGARKRLRSIASATLLLEGLLILSVVVGAPHGRSLAWPMMLASAMGLQTATLTRVGSLTVHTTFVTGMLNKLAQLMSHGVFICYDRMRGRITEAAPGPVFRQARFIFGIWMMYLAGAAIGRSLVLRWNIRALLLPLAAITVAIMIDQAVPLSIEEEHDEVDPGRKFPPARDHYRHAA